MQLAGKARLGRKTKDLAKVLLPKEIAIIDHQDLDAMGALGLVQAGVIGVINAADSITGRYPNLGPKMLLANKVFLIDKVGAEIFNLIKSGDLVTIKGAKVLVDNQVVVEGRTLSYEAVLAAMEQAKTNLDIEIDKFVDNTVEYVKKEKEIMLTGIVIPEIDTIIEGRHVVIVVRGMGYQEDLEAIGSYIEEMNPILIGVDGGADALLEYGHKPDLIMGDMDSVTDYALNSKAEILVHAYQDGECPGAKRLEALEVKHKIFPAPGTSEDIALLLAYELGARLIVAVGLHSNLIDFLEKGRSGMASTFLVRMKIGSILVDAKGVSQLYTGKPGLFPVPVMIAAVIPILLFIALASPWRQLVRLLWLQIRLFVGGM